MSWNLLKLLPSFHSGATAEAAPARGAAVEAPRFPLPDLGPYQVLGKIGDGGMATVYKARHRQTGQIVAVKVLSPEVAGKPVLVKRFEQEFQAASRLRHPNIVHSLDFGCAGQQPYLVMEFVDGESLGRRLDRQGRLPPAEAVRLVAQVGRALEYVHQQGLVHRDVKPDNILLTPAGQTKLTDLGLVKQAETDLDLTRTGQGLGTPNFMAPEQFSDAKNIDPRCDVYGLGATLYMLLTGELPFAGRNFLQTLKKKAANDLTPPCQLVPSLDPAIERALIRAMSPERSKRHPSCAEFVRELLGREAADLEREAPAAAPAEEPFDFAQLLDDANKPAPRGLGTRPGGSSGRTTVELFVRRRPGSPSGPTGTDWTRWQWLLAGAVALGVALVGFFMIHAR